jgi:tetratricopeptide (TPR) repeat protein
LTNSPNLHTSVYVYGEEVFDGLAMKEKNPARKTQLIDSLLMIYDMRIANCGEEKSVMNRKAFFAYKHLINSDEVDKLLEIMDADYKLNGTGVSDGLHQPYMQTIRMNKLKKKNLTDEEVINRYDVLMEIVDAKIKKARSEGKPVDKLEADKKMIDDIFITLVDFNCDLVKTNLEPKFKENPDDLSIAKKMVFFMIKGKCTDDPIWLKAAETVMEKEPDFGLGKNIAIRYLVAENYTKAETYFKIVLEIAPTNTDKAEVLIYLGSIESKKGSKVAARNYYREASSADPANKDSYEKIGDLYMNSFDDCKKLDNMADDRLVYLAAYEMYQRAGDAKKMGAAKAQFPSKEELFTQNYSAGDTKTVGCWINESVVLRTRD